MLTLVALLLPLALDSFAVAAALGIAGLPATQRLRLSLVFAAFEGVMPLIGVGIGHAAGSTIGSLADRVAAILLIALGAYLLVADDAGEIDRATSLSRVRGLALISLGISISLDELAIGFNVGLLDLPLGAAIILIAGQAFVAAQLGVRFGARLGEQRREHVERAAAIALLAIGIVLSVQAWR